VGTVTDDPGYQVPSEPVTRGDAAQSGQPAPQSSAADAESLPPPVSEATDILALIDRLSAVLERSDLTEVEIQAGGTGLVLRKPAALAPAVVLAGAPPTGLAALGSATGATVAGGAAELVAGVPEGTGIPATPSVKAPLTGIWYGSPAPGSPPYVQVGGEVAIGQTIGLIEAMKLFNEIKSDLAGRVVRMLAEPGQLVKAKQPLIEVEPL
jgi:acetyl-CoA carboxylase biotin carboxyl carrier protein